MKVRWSLLPRANCADEARKFKILILSVFPQFPLPLPTPANCFFCQLENHLLILLIDLDPVLGQLIKV